MSHLIESPDIRHEYCCTVVRIGRIMPIEGKDRIGQTLVNGVSVVIRKDQVKEGDIMLYAANETALSAKFLSANNLYAVEEYERNANAAEVRALLDEDRKDDAKKLCGFFNKNARVRLIRLGGIPSYGFLFRQEELAKAFPDTANEDLDAMVGQDFDTVCGERFVKAYVPPVQKKRAPLGPKERRNRRLRRYARLIPEQFLLHYDTDMLARNMTKLHPDSIVDISVKLHGTSISIGNVLVKKPRFGGFYRKIFPYLPKFLQWVETGYDIVYASRNVVKNEYITGTSKEHYYGTDIWGEYAVLLDGLIPQGWTLYGEIVGYLTGTSSTIQPHYDYGCPEGNNRLMIYRISVNDGDSKRELEVPYIKEWTEQFIKDHPELADRLHPIDLLYHGTMGDLYPDIPLDTDWRDNVLLAMKADKNRFGMEKDEPLCHNKVPREGIVLRISNDCSKEAFKLKTDKFFGLESKLIDEGIVDMEMTENYQPTET